MEKVKFNEAWPSLYSGLPDYTYSSFEAQVEGHGALHCHNLVFCYIL